MSRGRKAGGSVSLALVAVLAFSALAASAAQASPAWHRNGKTLKEAGLTQMGIQSTGGNVKIEVPGWNITVNCSENLGWGYAIGESSGTYQIKASGCKVKGLEKQCTVKPMTFQSLSLGLTTGGNTGVIETFTPTYSDLVNLEFSGALCPLNEYSDILYYDYYGGSSLGAEVGAEAALLPLTGISSHTLEAAMGEEPVYISLSGSITQTETGGAKIGAW